VRKLLGSALTVLLVAVAWATPSAAQVAQDSVVGSGTTSTFTFDLDARSGPSGENATGTARLALIDSVITFEGPVTCLSVSANRAIIGIDNSLGFQGLGRPVFIVVTDGTPDSIGAFVPGSGEPPTVCPPSVVENTIPERIISGDITVVDAPPLPTSKDQCKNGGWQTFGIFKNQGDCVSFVATHGKNPPGTKGG